MFAWFAAVDRLRAIFDHAAAPVREIDSQVKVQV